MELEEDQIEGLGDLGVLPSEVIISVVAKSHVLDALSLCQVSRSMRSHASHHAGNLVRFVATGPLNPNSNDSPRVSNIQLQKERLMQRAFYFIDSKRPKISVVRLYHPIRL